MAIQAIETHYAGCRFRSRLEARWAVYLDYLGIPWEYEPQGFHCTWRLSLREEPAFPYLPDFWLPTIGCWAEVKGSLAIDEHIRLLNAAAYLSSGGAGGCGYDNQGSADLIVLGPIPRPRPHTTWLPQPVRLHMHKGDLIASPWPGGKPHQYMQLEACIARDVGDGGQNGIFDAGLKEHQVRRLLINGMEFDGVGYAYVEALNAARSARFEHGETPTPPQHGPTLASVARHPRTAAEAARDALSSARRTDGVETLIRHFGGGLVEDSDG